MSSPKKEILLIGGKRLNELRVADLRAELDKRKLETSGIKVVLVDRLTDALITEKMLNESLKGKNQTADAEKVGGNQGSTAGASRTSTTADPELLDRVIKTEKEEHEEILELPKQLYPPVNAILRETEKNKASGTLSFKEILESYSPPAENVTPISAATSTIIRTPVKTRQEEPVKQSQSDEEGTTTNNATSSQDSGLSGDWESSGTPLQSQSQGMTENVSAPEYEYKLPLDMNAVDNNTINELAEINEAEGVGEPPQVVTILVSSGQNLAALEKGDGEGDVDGSNQCSTTDRTQHAYPTTSSDDKKRLSNTSTCSSQSESQGESQDDGEGEESELGEGSARTTVLVKGLSTLTKASDVKTLFKKFGKIANVKIILNARYSKGVGKGRFAQVEMMTEVEARRAVDNLNDTSLHGRQITVEKAQPDIIPVLKGLNPDEAQEKSDENPVDMETALDNSAEAEENISGSINNDDVNPDNNANSESQSDEILVLYNNIKVSTNSNQEEVKNVVQPDTTMEEEDRNDDGKERNDADVKVEVLSPKKMTVKKEEGDTVKKEGDKMEDEIKNEVDIKNEDEEKMEGDSSVDTKTEKSRRDSRSSGQRRRERSPKQRESPSRQRLNSSGRGHDSWERGRDTHNFDFRGSRFSRGHHQQPVERVERNPHRHRSPDTVPGFPRRYHGPMQHRFDSPTFHHNRYHHIRPERDNRERDEDHREFERRNRSRELARREDFSRHRELERRNERERIALEREKERLRHEREKVERDKEELLRIEREHQRKERARIEREREELRKVQLDIEQARHGSLKRILVDEEDRSRDYANKRQRLNEDRFPPYSAYPERKANGAEAGRFVREESGRGAKERHDHNREGQHGASRQFVAREQLMRDAPARDSAPGTPPWVGRDKRPVELRRKVAPAAPKISMMDRDGSGSKTNLPFSIGRSPVQLGNSEESALRSHAISSMKDRRGYDPTKSDTTYLTRDEGFMRRQATTYGTSAATLAQAGLPENWMGSRRIPPRNETSENWITGSGNAMPRVRTGLPVAPPPPQGIYNQRNTGMAFGGGESMYDNDRFARRY